MTDKTTYRQQRLTQDPTAWQANTLYYIVDQENNSLSLKLTNHAASVVFETPSLASIMDALGADLLQELEPRIADLEDLSHQHPYLTALNTISLTSTGHISANGVALDGNVVLKRCDW